MNKFIKSLFTLLLVGGLTGSLFAQVMNESVNLNAKATILTSLSITKDVDLNFGNISASTPGIVRLMPDGSASNYAGNSATTGKLTINGATNTDVMINYPAGVILQTDNFDQIYYHIHVSGNLDNDQGSSIQLSNVGISGNVQVKTNGDGDYYLFVGGALGGSIYGFPAPLNNQPTGEYTGSVMFEVKYN